MTRFFPKGDQKEREYVQLKKTVILRVKLNLRRERLSLKEPPMELNVPEKIDRDIEVYITSGVGDICLRWGKESEVHLSWSIIPGLFFFCLV
jgi:hypothetical protein